VINRQQFVANVTWNDLTFSEYALEFKPAMMIILATKTEGFAKDLPRKGSN
ncbi:MAG: hypothetical protein ACJAZM_002127, partial [Cyclobacteriaceae bacterium]